MPHELFHLSWAEWAAIMAIVNAVFAVLSILVAAKWFAFVDVPVAGDPTVTFN